MGETDANRSADPLIGTMVDRYRIEELVGLGGMGRVYLAVQPDIGSRVAIKVVQAGGHETDRIKRMLAEAKAVNLIHHEHIVNVLDMAYLEDGRPALVMEFLTGDPLSTLVHDRTLALDHLLSLTLEVLSALAAAHSVGILHRDLKPANVFVSPKGHATVLDFGLAKFVYGAPSDVATTRDGKVMGTLQYMSPEQALGEDLDARSDLFAVGLLMYEVITGEKAIVGRNLSEIHEAHKNGPPPIRALAPTVPESVEALVEKALATDPADRYDSARDMMSAVQRVFDELPARFRGPRSSTRPWSRAEVAAELAESLAAEKVSVDSDDRTTSERKPVAPPQAPEPAPAKPAPRRPDSTDLSLSVPTSVRWRNRIAVVAVGVAVLAFVVLLVISLTGS